MRSPRRQRVGASSSAAAAASRGGRRESLPLPFRATRVRDHRQDEWGHDRERGRTPPSPRAPRERLHRMSPDFHKMKRREYASSSSSSLHSHSAQPRGEYRRDDEDCRIRQGCEDPPFGVEHALDRYLDLQRPIRMVPVSSLEGEEGLVPRPSRPHVEDGVALREVVVQRVPRFSGDGRVGRDIVVSSASRFLQGGGNDTIVPNPPRYLEDGQSGRETLIPKQGYLEDDPAHAFLGQTIDHHRRALIKLGSGSGANSSTRSGVHGEEEHDLWYRHHHPLEDGGDRERMYTRDASYPGLPPLQMRAISGLPSGLPDDGDAVFSYQDSLHSPSKDSYNISNASNLSDRAFRHEEHAQIQHLHVTKRQVVSSLIREDSQNEGYSEFVRRGSTNRLLPLAEDGNPNQIPWEPQDGYGKTLNPGHHNTFPSGDRIDESGSSSKPMRRAYLLDHQSSIRNDRISAYRHATHVSEEYTLGRESVEHMPRSTEGHDLSHGETEYNYDGDDNIVGSYKGRSRISLMDNQFEDIYRENASSPRRVINIQDLDMYDVSGDRSLIRYVSDNELDVVDDRSPYLTTCRGHDRELDNYEDHWTSKDRAYQASKRSVTGRLQQRILYRRTSDSNHQRLHRGSFGSREAQRVNFKRRLRYEPSNFVVNFPFKRKPDFYHHHRYWRKNDDDQNDFGNIRESDVQEGYQQAQREPPENSEEFRHQVHKAFLRFIKPLNDDQHQLKRYGEQEKGGSLLCFVCGSLSKEFVDTHSLVMHAFNSLKNGLRTDHLGLHKALCVLMGWNWQVPPDGGKYYQSVPSSEASAMKEDLILWPPLVIIHNSSIRNNKNAAAGSEIVTKEGLEKILKDIGVGVGKARVSLGKPADHSVMLVKFLPTFSGLQEAENLHKHYLDSGRGRKEFRSLGGSVVEGGNNSGKETKTDRNAEQLLYGFLAIAEDLGKLDNDSKKRSIVKSKMEIEAIADAPLTSKETPVN